MWSLKIQLDFLHGISRVIRRWCRCQFAAIPRGGSGPRAPARYLVVSELPRHTIFVPSELKLGEKLPLLVWANGGGIAWGLMFADFHQELASHGYIIIANGSPTGWGSMGAEGQLESIKWALQPPNSFDDMRNFIDTSRIALAGQSKGGVRTYEAAAALRDEPRVKTIGLFNSGLMLPRKKDKEMLAGLKTSLYYFVGDSRDVLYKNASRDWELLSEDARAYFASLDVGHLGTFYEENGGLYAEAAVKWLNAELKGDKSSKDSLLAPNESWTIRSRNL